MAIGLTRVSFKTRLILSYIFVILISFGFITFFLDKKLEEISLRDIQSSLITQARLIENQIAPEAVEKEDIAQLEALVNALKPKAKCRLTIIDTRGKVLADSEKSEKDIPHMENHLTRPEVQAALTGATGANTRYSETIKINMLYVAVPLKDNSRVTGIVRLALPLESVQRTLGTIRRIVVLGLIFALALASITGYLVASQTLRPINRMIQVSRKFSEGDFSRRIIYTTKDEIGELAVTLNKMAQDIEDKINQIKTQNQNLAAIFNSMIEGVMVVDKAARIISINPAVEKIFGVSAKDTEGAQFLEAIRNTDISEVINNVLKKGEPLSGEISPLLPMRKIFQFNATPIFYNKAVNGCLIVIHDITDIRKLETVRSDFVANVSHELKTPLTSIKGFVETLLEGALDDKENNHAFLKIIQEHTQRLDNLTNDLLSLSGLESKEITLEKKEFNLRRQAEEVILGFGSQLRKKNITVKNDLPLNLSIKADKNRMAQVLTNLMDNAIKFNKDKGLISIYTKEGDGGIMVVVEDSGIGIPQKDIPRIFERFYRVDKARSRELGGTGLGLSIVRHIIELHKGNVGVESNEGFGSKFWFTLPK